MFELPNLVPAEKPTSCPGFLPSDLGSDTILPPQASDDQGARLKARVLSSGSQHPESVPIHLRPDEASHAGDYRPFRLRKETAERVEAGRQIILEELKPNPAQLRRGLDLHFNSYVAEVMGSLYVADPVITMIGDRLREDLAQYRRSLEAEGLEGEELEEQVQERWRRMKAFESAFDPQWRQDYLGLYRLTGLDLAIEDVAHPPREYLPKGVEASCPLSVRV